MLSMLLLDLCAFNVTQMPPAARKKAMKSYREAYRLAERMSLPDLESYDNLMENIERV